MNRDTLKGQWTQFKGKVRQQWGKISDDDVRTLFGKADCCGLANARCPTRGRFAI